ncbi:MAG: DUF1905 domain-containing protein [Bacteroidia bacterium]
MPQLKLKTRLHREDIKGAWTYLVVRDASEVFGSNTNIPVKGTIDNYAIEGTLQPRGDGSHWFAVKKEVRDAIGKSIGETVDVLFEDNTVSILQESDNSKKSISKNKKSDSDSKNKKKQFFSRKKK